jgi:hypothetical protein
MKCCISWGVHNAVTRFECDDVWGGCGDGDGEWAVVSVVVFALMRALAGTASLPCGFHL